MGSPGFPTLGRMGWDAPADIGAVIERLLVI
jgi:hypothetical protein